MATLYFEVKKDWVKFFANADTENWMLFTEGVPVTPDLEPFGNIFFNDYEFFVSSGDQRFDVQDAKAQITITTRAARKEAVGIAPDKAFSPDDKSRDVVGVYLPSDDSPLNFWSYIYLSPDVFSRVSQTLDSGKKLVLSMSFTTDSALTYNSPNDHCLNWDAGVSTVMFPQEISLSFRELTSETLTWWQSEALRLAARERYPESNDIRDDVLIELVKSYLLANPEQLKALDLQKDQYETQAKTIAHDDIIWGGVDRLIAFADDAVRFSLGQSKDWWWHQNRIDLPTKSQEEHSVSLDGLTNCARAYIEAQWAKSPILEKWLVRKMIYAEGFAFISRLGSPLNPRRFKFWWITTKQLFVQVVGIWAAFSIGDTYGLAVGVLAFLLWLAASRYLAQRTLDDVRLIQKTFGYINQVYTLAIDTSVSPVELEKLLSLAEANDVAWPKGLRSIVEVALERNKLEWR
jgi:hypothetical protein